MEVDENLLRKVADTYEKFAPMPAHEQNLINPQIPFVGTDEAADVDVSSYAYFDAVPDDPPQENGSEQEIDETLTNNKTEEQNTKNIQELGYYSISSSKNKDMVNDLLKKGYTSEEALTTQKAKNAYKMCAALPKKSANSAINRFKNIQ